VFNDDIVLKLQDSRLFTTDSRIMRYL